MTYSSPFTHLPIYPFTFLPLIFELPHYSAHLLHLSPYFFNTTHHPSPHTPPPSVSGSRSSCHVESLQMFIVTQSRPQFPFDHCKPSLVPLDSDHIVLPVIHCKTLCSLSIRPHVIFYYSLFIHAASCSEAFNLSLFEDVAKRFGRFHRAGS